MKRFFLAILMGALTSVMFVATAGAAIDPPTVDVEPLAQGIVDALTTNLPTILGAAGVLAGVFFILRMARRWFGARSSA